MKAIAQMCASAAPVGSVALSDEPLYFRLCVRRVAELRAVQSLNEWVLGENWKAVQSAIGHLSPSPRTARNTSL
jgi:hypothetical protein